MADTFLDICHYYLIAYKDNILIPLNSITVSTSLIIFQSICKC